MKKTTPLAALLLAAGFFTARANAEDWENRNAHCVNLDPDLPSFEGTLLKDLGAALAPGATKLELPEKIDDKSLGRLANVCHLPFWRAVASEDVGPPDSMTKPTAIKTEGRAHFNGLGDLKAQVRLLHEYAKDFKAVQVTLIEARSIVGEYGELAGKMEKRELKDAEAAEAVGRLISVVGKPLSEKEVQLHDLKDRFARAGTLFGNKKPALGAVLAGLWNTPRVLGQLPYMNNKQQWDTLILEQRHDDLRAILTKMDPKLAQELTAVILDANKQLNRVNSQIAKTVYAAAFPKETLPASGLAEAHYEKIGGAQPLEALGKKTAVDFYKDILARSAPAPTGKPATAEEAKKEFEDKLNAALSERMLQWTKGKGGAADYASVEEWKKKDPIQYHASMHHLRRSIELSQNGKEILFKYKPSEKSHKFDLEKTAALKGSDRQAAIDREVKKIADLIFGKSADSPAVKAAAVGTSIERALRDIKDEGLRKEVKSMIEKGGPGSILAIPYEKYSRIAFEGQVKRELEKQAGAADRSVDRQGWAGIQLEEIQKVEARKKAELQDPAKKATLDPEAWEAHKKDVEERYTKEIEAVRAKYQRMIQTQTTAIAAGASTYREGFETILKSGDIRQDKSVYKARIITKVNPWYWPDDTLDVEARQGDIDRFYNERYVAQDGDDKKPVPAGVANPTGAKTLLDWKKANVEALYEGLKGVEYHEYPQRLKEEIGKAFVPWYRKVAQHNFDTR